MRRQGADAAKERRGRTRMAGKLPYIPFYTGDWLKDPELSLCAPATRGVWIDLLCAMHNAGCSGELRGTPEQLARAARCSTADIAQALTDLQTTGAADVTERNGVVTVVNRRMHRVAKSRHTDKLRQRRRRMSRSRHGPVTGDISDSSSEFKPPPPDVPPVNGQVQRELEEEVFACGVEDAPRAVNAALRAGCSPAEIRAAIAAWAAREDLGYGSLHYRILWMKPGQTPDFGWPSPPKEVVEKKAEDTKRQRAIEEGWRQAEATRIVRDGRKSGKSDDAIKAELSAVGLEWPN